jgi:hypothetical protein
MDNLVQMTNIVFTDLRRYSLTKFNHRILILIMNYEYNVESATNSKCTRTQNQRI